MGITYLPDGRTQIRHSFRAPGAAHPRAKQITINTQEKRAVLRAAAELIRSVEGSLISARVEDILSHYEQHRGESSYTRGLKEDLGRLRINRGLQREWGRYLLAMRGRGLAQGTVNKFAATLRAAMNLALRSGLLGDVDTLPIRHWGIRQQPPRDVVLSPQQRGMLLATIDREAPHLSAITRYAMAVPSRRSELVDMQPADVDLIHQRIRVRCADSKSGAGMWKPIPPDMLEYFRDLPADAPRVFYRVDPETGEKHPLGNFKRAWGRALRIAGIGGFRFHDTRHMAATAMVDAGTPPPVVQQIAGWKTDMLRVYYHRDPAANLGLVRWEGCSSSVVDAPDAEVQNGCF